MTSSIGPSNVPENLPTSPISPPRETGASNPVAEVDGHTVTKVSPNSSETTSKINKLFRSFLVGLSAVIHPFRKFGAYILDTLNIKMSEIVGKVFPMNCKKKQIN